MEARRVMHGSGEVGGYRPVSRLAVAAGVAGVVASLALLTPMLWVLSLVGVGLAIAGLADVARPGAEKAGRAAALAGLALSVGFGAQSVTAGVVSRWITEARARAVVGTWLDALQEGRLDDARSMLAAHVLPDPEPGQAHVAPGPGDGHAHPAGGRPSIDTLPAVRALLACGPAAVRGIESAGRDEETGERWCVRLRLEPCGDGGTVTLRLQLQPVTVREANRRVERWSIQQIDRES